MSVTHRRSCLKSKENKTTLTVPHTEKNFGKLYSYNLLYSTVQYMGKFDRDRLGEGQAVGGGGYRRGRL